MSDIEWRSRASCRTPEKYGLDAEDWFPLPSQQGQDAKNVCLGCPVRKDCAIEANRSGQHGIWAGFSLPKQRRSLRRYLNLVTGSDEQDRAEEAASVVATCADCGAEIQAKFPTQLCRPCVLGKSRQEPRVLIDVIRPHLLDLRAAGWTNRAIAAVSSVHHQTVHSVVSERALSVTRSTANKLLAVTGSPPARTPGMCPECGEEMPLTAASDKCGHRGYCSKKCRAARQAVNA